MATTITAITVTNPTASCFTNNCFNSCNSFLNPMSTMSTGTGTVVFTATGASGIFSFTVSGTLISPTLAQLGTSATATFTNVPIGTTITVTATVGGSTSAPASATVSG